MEAAAPSTRPGRSVPLWSLVVPVLVVVTATAAGAGAVLIDRSPKTPWIESRAAAVGQKAPDFQSWDLDGNTVRLSDLKGHPVLLTFWATSCTACQDEFPALQQIQLAHRAAGMRVLAVDYRETNTSTMRQFLDRMHVTFTPVLDPQATIASAYGVDIGLPVNVWVDSRQNVAQMMLGAQPETQLAAAAQQIAG